jgi:hypothetical protein
MIGTEAMEFVYREEKKGRITSFDSQPAGVRAMLGKDILIERDAEYYPSIL